MKRRYALFAVLIVYLSLPLAAAPAEREGKLIRAAVPVKGSYIVVFNDSVQEQTEEIADEMARRFGVKNQRVLLHALQGFTARMNEAQAAAIARDRRVRFVEEDAVVTLEATQTLPSFEWYALDRIDQRERLGPYPYTMTYNYCQDGTGVNVYVIDTGVWREHVDFWRNGQSRVTAGADFTMGADGTADNPCPNESTNFFCWEGSNLQNVSHGTGVASIIGGTLYGVAKNATIIPVRVFACSQHESYNVTSLLWGIDWVAAHHQPGTPAVANMSFSTPWNYNDGNALMYAVNNLVADGVTVVAAAGNFNRDACGYVPGNVANVITVGGSDHWDHRWVDPFNGDFGSNWGNCIDLFAPAAMPSADMWSCEDDYGPWHHNPAADRKFSTVGTSFATALVSGVAAQYLQMHPTATPAEVENWIKTNATIGALHTTSPDLGGPNRLLYTNCQ